MTKPPTVTVSFRCPVALERSMLRVVQHVEKENVTQFLLEAVAREIQRRSKKEKKKVDDSV